MQQKKSFKWLYILLALTLILQPMSLLQVREVSAASLDTNTTNEDTPSSGKNITISQIDSVDNTNGKWQYKGSVNYWIDITDENKANIKGDQTIRFFPENNSSGYQTEFKYNGNETIFVNVIPVNDAPYLTEKGAVSYLDFGQNNYVTYPSLDIYSNSFTYESWINVSETGNWSRIFDSSYGMNNSNIHLAFDGRFLGKMTLEAQVPLNNGTTSYKVTTNESFPLNQWVHVAAVYDHVKKESYIYWNGVKKNTTSYINDILNQSKNNEMNLSTMVVTGERPNNFLGESTWAQYDDSFMGGMRDVRFWNKAKTQAEIQQQMNDYINTPDSNLVLNYKFDDSEAIEAIDSTGHGLNGDFHGTTLIGKGFTKDLVTNQDTPVSKEFKLFDVDSENLTVTADSADLTLVPKGNITLDVSSSDVTMIITPGEGKIGSTEITVKVIDDEGATYTSSFILKVNETIKSNDPNLTAIKVNDGVSEKTITTSGDTINIGKVSTDTITLTPITAPGATVIFNGSPSNEISLVEGKNIITVIVTAENGIDTKTYTLEIYREYNPKLSSLEINEGTLTPIFNPEITDYTMEVGNDTSTINIAPTAVEGSTIKVNGKEISSGSPNTNVNLTEGQNEIKVDVTKEGITKTYTIKVNREETPKLSNLEIDGGTLSPTFNPETTDYTIEVGNSTSSINIAPTSEEGSVIKVNGKEVNSGSPNANIDLKEGQNEITVEVTKDGVTKTYTITVYREPSPKLSKLEIDGGTLTPAFNSETTDYTMEVENSTSSIKIAPTSGEGTTVKVNGEALASGAANISLNEGKNIIKVEVSKGELTKTYTITVNRKASSKGSSGSDSGSKQPTTEKIKVDVETGNLGGKVVNQTEITRTKETDGSIHDKVVLTETNAKEAIQNIKDAGQDTARTVIPDANDEVSKVEFSVTKEATKELGDNNINLEVYTENVRIQVPESSLDNFNEDLYFRLVPIKEEQEQKEVENRARVEAVVKDFAKDKEVNVVARPMTIETNLQSRPVTLVLPLRDVTLPTDEKQREAFLNNLVIFIEHSDGEKELIKPQVVDFKEGQLGLQFGVDKFSTFTILNMEGWEDLVTNQPDGSNQQGENGQQTTVTHSIYIKGSENKFRPNESVSREQMAAMLARNLNALTTNTKEYKDVKQTNWAFQEILEAKSAGIMTGVTLDEFDPKGHITRAQMATIAYRWIQKECQQDATSYEGCAKLANIKKANYKDVSAKHWAIDAISFMESTDIMVGYSDNTFHPNDKLTRAQAVKVLNRLFKRGPLTNVTTPTFKDVPKTHWAFDEIEEAAREHEIVLDKTGTEILK